ncbi:MAG TPA: nuclear transport factor 2 family protein [Pseudonocardiaceae bacterium]|nr:nuclear transport factor 2 family protein [Pseudonocardiaceae bacterium]
MDTNELIRTGVSDWNRRDKDAFLTNFDPSCEITGPGGLMLRGRDGAELFWHIYQDAFPDNHITVRAIVGTADAATVEAVFEGTHAAALRRVDGSQVVMTGRTARITYAAVHTYRNKQITTLHLYFDQTELLAQLGVGMPPRA